MRFEVPQFIEIEDKIVGPLTWKQFVYIAGGIGLSILEYFILPSFFLFVIVAIPTMALAGFLAFHKVNNRPFSSFLEAMFNYAAKSRLYLWKKEEQQAVVDREQEEIAPSIPKELPLKKNITTLSRKLDMNTLTK